MPDKNLIFREMGPEGSNLATALQATFVSGVLAVAANGAISALDPNAGRILSTASLPTQLTDLPEPLQSIIREVQASGSPAVDRKLKLDLPGGPRTVTTTILPADTSKPGSVVVLMKEVSGASQLELNLRRLDRLASAGTLAASMAHEIKNALVPIKTFIDLLLEKNPDAELSGMVKREVGRIDAILSHMLSFGAPVAPVFAPVRLHQILEHSVRLARHRTGGKSISIQTGFEAGNDELNGDERQLEQAFVNLLINAVEAMSSEGTLIVRTHLPGKSAAQISGNTPAQHGHLLIHIQDTGPGITQENLNRVFEPFFTTKANGTGLGLAVTRRIIEQHQGAIHVASEPGKGTTFTVMLPAAAPSRDS